MGESSEKQTKADEGQTTKSKGEAKARQKKDGPKKESFWQGIKSEYRKITWPDKQSTLKQSVVVTVISIVLGLIIAIIDYAAKFGVNFLTQISL